MQNEAEFISSSPYNPLKTGLSKQVLGAPGIRNGDLLALARKLKYSRANNAPENIYLPQGSLLKILFANSC